MKFSYLLVFLVCLAMVFGAATCAREKGNGGYGHHYNEGDGHRGGGNDDDDGYEEDPVEVVEAIVNEIVEGLLARTPEALEEKVFPYVADSYDYAGLDDKGFKKFLLAELKHSPDLLFVDYEVSVDVEKHTPLYVGIVEIAYTAVQLPGNDRDVPLNLVGVKNLELRIYHMGGDVPYQLIGLKTVDGAAEISGGEGVNIVYSSDFMLNETEVLPNGLLTLGGMIRVPQLAEGERLQASIGLNWGDRRGNAQVWQNTESVVYSRDWTDRQGQIVIVDLTLPDDGLPVSSVVPEHLPLGVRSLDYRILFTCMGADGVVRGASGLSYTLPVLSGRNSPYCAQSLDEDADGIWLLRLDDGSFQLLDVRGIGYRLFGAALPSPMKEALDLTGYELAGKWVLKTNMENAQVVYQAVRQGDRLVGGTIEELFSDGSWFVGRKLSNRCVGLSPYDLSGAALRVDFDDRSLVCLAQRNGEEVSINCGTEHFSGRMARNVLLARNTTDNTMLLLAFADNFFAEALLVEPSSGESRSGMAFVQ